MNITTILIEANNNARRKVEPLVMKAIPRQKPNATISSLVPLGNVSPTADPGCGGDIGHPTRTKLTLPL